VDAKPSAESIRQTIDLIKVSLSWLELSSIAQKVSSIEEDFLGAYFFHIPVIHIYWQAIGIASAFFKIPPDTLTIVVLAQIEQMDDPKLPFRSFVLDGLLAPPLAPLAKREWQTT
jgi:hypothetical protein